MAKAGARAKREINIYDKYPKITRLPIHEKCEGCSRIIEQDGKKVCSKYADPSFHWEDGHICAFATHVKREVKVEKKVINPLKASKRAARGRK